MSETISDYLEGLRIAVAPLDMMFGDAISDLGGEIDDSDLKILEDIWDKASEFWTPLAKMCRKYENRKWSGEEEEDGEPGNGKES